MTNLLRLKFMMASLVLMISASIKQIDGWLTLPVNSSGSGELFSFVKGTQHLYLWRKIDHMPARKISGIENNLQAECELSIHRCQ